MDIAQIRGIILFLGAFLELILTLVLWLKGKSRESFHLGWATFFSAIYCVTWGGVFLLGGDKVLWHRATWVGILIVPASIAFVYVFTGRTKHFRLITFIWYSAAIVVLFFALTTPHFVKGIYPKYPYDRQITGSLDPFGRMLIVVGVPALYYLLKEYFKAKGLRKLQIKYFIIGVSIPSIAGFLTAGLIPIIFPDFVYKDISALATVPGVTLVTYAIFKRRVFGIRVILTEILVASIGIILLIQTLLAENQPAKILGFITLAAFLFVGYLLIRITQKEIKRKEQAEGLSKQLRQLNETLEDRVKQRTKELEKSYQEIKKRKDELEKFYGLTVGRELKMVELKKEIKELKERLEEKGLR